MVDRLADGTVLEKVGEHRAGSAAANGKAKRADGAPSRQAEVRSLLARRITEAARRKAATSEG